MTREACATISFVASHLAPQLGIERSLVRLLSLLNAVVDADVYALGGDIDDLAVLPGLKIVGPPLRGWRRILSYGRVRRLARHLENSETVILVGLWAALPYLAFAPRRGGRRILIWEHSLMRERVRAQRSMRLLSFLARLLYPRADGIVCVSEPQASFVSEMFPRMRVTTIPNFLPAEATLDQPAYPRDRVLLCIGSLKGLKNQQLILRAVDHLRDLDLEIVFLGDGPDRTLLENLAADLRLDGRTTFEGHVPPARVSEALRRCAVVVQPTRSETFGLAYFEAAAAGAPLVAVRNDVSNWLVPAYVPGTLANDDPVDLANKIRDCIERPPDPERRQAAQASRMAVFSAASITQGWVRLLAERPDNAHR